MKTNERIESLQKQVLGLAKQNQIILRRLNYNRLPEPPPYDSGDRAWFGNQEVRIEECSHTIAKVRVLPDENAMRWHSDSEKYLLVEIEMLSREKCANRK